MQEAKLNLASYVCKVSITRIQNINYCGVRI